MGFIKRLHSFIRILRKTGDAGMTMRFRLFTFLIALVVLMISSVVITLLISGPLTDGQGEAKEFVRKELTRVSDDLAAQYGDVTVQLTRLSESISTSIEVRLRDKEIPASKLQAHPEVLEEVIEGELDRLLLALDKTGCSGVFMILDATVGPELAGAGHSRAGISVRITEPKLSGPDMARRYVRGFPGVAYRNGFSMLSNWDMEFDVEDRAYYRLPLEKYKEIGLPLSRLYYWGFESVISDGGGSMILCCVPLISSGGEALGVCGFEISAVNFISDYSPAASEYRHAFGMLSCLTDNGLDTGRALFSGNQPVSCAARNNGPLLRAGGNGLNIYRQQNGKTFVGLHEEVKLYPVDSAFADQRFAVALLIPKGDLDALVLRRNVKLIMICAALLLLGLCVSVFISRKYLNPIMSVFDDIHSDRIDVDAKTNILEIDRLIELIRETKENTAQSSGRARTAEEFDALNLSPREKEVAALLLRGMTMRQVSADLGISESTVHGYCRTLYKRLGINSRTELLVRFGVTSLDNTHTAVNPGLKS